MVDLDTATEPRGPTPVMSGSVRQIAVPPAARALSTLSRVDYGDAFLVDTGLDQDRSGEQWSRVILEGAPVFLRRRLRWGWFALGLRLAPTRTDRFVLGWEVRRNTPDFALLGAGGRLGLSGELLFQPEQDTLLFATFVRQENPIARAAWAAVAPGHRRVVRYLLQRAARAQSGAAANH